MALFGAPIAYEDHAPRAVLAALGLLRRIRERLADVAHTYGQTSLYAWASILVRSWLAGSATTYVWITLR